MKCLYTYNYTQVIDIVINHCRQMDLLSSSTRPFKPCVTGIDMINVPNCSQLPTVKKYLSLSIPNIEGYNWRQSKKHYQSSSQAKRTIWQKASQARSFSCRLYSLEERFSKEKASPRQIGSYMGWSLQNNQIDWQGTVCIRRLKEGSESSEWCPPQAIPHPWESISRFKLP